MSANGLDRVSAIRAIKKSRHAGRRRDLLDDIALTARQARPVPSV